MAQQNGARPAGYDPPLFKPEIARYLGRGEKFVQRLWQERRLRRRWMQGRGKRGRPFATLSDISRYLDECKQGAFGDE